MIAALTFAAGFVAFPLLLVVWAILWDLRPEAWASRRVFRGLKGWNAGVAVPRSDPFHPYRRTLVACIGRIRIVGEQDFTFRGDHAEEIVAFAAAPGFGVRAWRGGRTHDKRQISDCIIARAFGFHLRLSHVRRNPDRFEIAEYEARKEAEWKATVDGIMERA